MFKRALSWICAMLAGCMLTGCGALPRLTLNPEELYTLPELPSKYEELNRSINEILGGGAEYAAPTAGTNVQSVQMVDLDGDGREEAVAFFRKPEDEKPLKICVFAAEGDTYRRVNLIEGTGTAIYSVAYSDLDGDGTQELAVSWRAAAELQVLEIYAPLREDPKPLLRTDYVRYAFADLDQDRRQELVVLRAGEDGESGADYYGLQPDGSLALRSSARISGTMAELSQQGRVTAGTLKGGTPALFVTSVTEQLSAVTDVLALRGGEFTNLVLDPATGVSRDIVPFVSLYPTDINGDGVTELPRPAPLTGRGLESGAEHLTEWRSCSEEGHTTLALTTYHNLEDGWYLRLPDTWRERVFVLRSSTAGESAAAFCVEEGTQLRTLLRISTLTGTGRETRAMRGERFVLSRQTESIFTAELPESGRDWPYSLTEEQVRSAFSRIQKDWING